MLTVTSQAPFIPLPVSWEAYLASLASRRRQPLRRAEAELEAWAGEPLRLREGAFASPSFARFHDIVMPSLLPTGALEVAWLEARGEPVSALHSFVWNGRVRENQSGRRTDTHPHLRPGIVIHAHAIQRAIELGRSEYDFLGGAARYKLDFSLATRPLATLSAKRPGLRRAARAALDT